MKIVCIEMPTAEMARNDSERYATINDLRERNERERREKKCREDLPNFIQKINSEIQNACEKGVRGFSMSFDDETFNPHHDIRCVYTLKGEFRPEMAKELTEIYKELGFNGGIYHYWKVHDRCYRAGEVHLWW